jgi:threonine dehydrogenase-like Zn-dependent dehydrogenase
MMRAVRLSPGLVQFVTDAPVPQPPEGEVLVRVLQAGICETDLQLTRGYMGFRGTLGHEFVGIAESGKYAGRRVVGEINCPCGTCEYCDEGLGNHCPNRTVLGIDGRDGAFADFLCLPERNLHPVPDDLPTELAVFTEPVAAALRLTTQFTDWQDRDVIVLGGGRLGNLCAQALADSGAKLRVVGKHPTKLTLLQDEGIETVLLADVEHDRRIADVVIDCTGSDSGFPQAKQFVRPQGTILLKTTVSGEQTLSLASLVIDEVTVIGSRCGPFPEALEALRDGRVNVRPLISATRPIEEARHALDQARHPDVLKVLLDVNAE